MHQFLVVFHLDLHCLIMFARLENNIFVTNEMLIQQRCHIKNITKHRLLYRKFVVCISACEDGASASIVANAILDAAQKGLDTAALNLPLIHTFWLLTQLPITAQTSSPSEYNKALQDLGIHVSDPASALALVIGFNSAIDDYVEERGGKSDIGEISQQAGSESLMKIIGAETNQLFESSPNDRQWGKQLLR